MNAVMLAVREPADLMELVFVIDAKACERARQVKLAMYLLRSGMPTREIRREMQRRFGVSQPTAWRIVDMAVDMAGPV
jgi:hypothetical protein